MKPCFSGITRISEIKIRLLWVTGCLSEGVAATAGVPQIAADLTTARNSAALAQGRTFFFNQGVPGRFEWPRSSPDTVHNQ